MSSDASDYPYGVKPFVSDLMQREKVYKEPGPQELFGPESGKVFPINRTVRKELYAILDDWPIKRRKALSYTVTLSLLGRLMQRVDDPRSIGINPQLLNTKYGLAYDTSKLDLATSLVCVQGDLSNPEMWLITDARTSFAIHLFAKMEEKRITD